MTTSKKSGGSGLVLAEINPQTNWPPKSLSDITKLDPYFKWSRTIMVDLHGVIFDWEARFQEFATKYHGFTFNNVNREFYDLARDPNTPISPEQFSELFVQFVKRASGGYGDLDPIPGVIEQLALIKKAGIRVLICTWTPGAADARPDGSATYGTGIAQKETEDLILRHMSGVVGKSDIVYASTHGKKRFMVEERIPVIIEDNAETAVGVAQSAMAAIVMPQPYNAGLQFRNVLRLDSSNQLAHAVLTVFDKLDDDQALALA